jgi:type VI secretion system protein ImpM
MTTVVTAGFYGKLPARGDFVRAGLPRDFVDAWDRWWQSMIPASRGILGEAWVPAWLEAPIWRFALSAGLCGPGSVIGVWMPSVDRAGRYFPLTIAAVAGPDGWADLSGAPLDFLEAAEQAGLDALEQDLTPDAMAERIGAARAALVAPAASFGGRAPASHWWTEGGPRVAARTMTMAGLPDRTAFLGMLDDGWAGGGDSIQTADGAS